MCRLWTPESDPLTTFVQLLPSFCTDGCCAMHSVAVSAISSPSCFRFVIFPFVSRLVASFTLLIRSSLNQFPAVATATCETANGCTGFRPSPPDAAAQRAHCCRSALAPADAAPQLLLPDSRPTSATPAPHRVPAHRLSHKVRVHPALSVLHQYSSRTARHRSVPRVHGCRSAVA